MTTLEARLIRVWAVNMVLCASLSVLVQAQAGTTPKRSNDMTKQKTPAAPLRARATRPASVNDTAIRPFHVKISDEALADLRRRVKATRWPTRELVKDRSQGVQLAA